MEVLCVGQTLKYVSTEIWKVSKTKDDENNNERKEF
jgi:hypothetical protein